MRVWHEEKPTLPERLAYVPVPRPPPSAPPPINEAAPARAPETRPSPPLPPRTPPIYPRTPPRTPLDLVGLDADVPAPSRSPNKRLPALTESTSAPMLARSVPHKMQSGDSHLAHPITHGDFRPGSVHPYLEGSMELTKRNRRLEAELARVSEQLAKERKGRKAHDERRVAEEEVARKLLQQTYEEQLQRMRADFEQRLSAAKGASVEDRGQLEALEKQHREQLQAQEAQERKARIELLRRQVGRRMLNRNLSLGFLAWFECWRAKVSATPHEQITRADRSNELSAGE